MSSRTGAFVAALKHSSPHARGTDVNLLTEETVVAAHRLVGALR